MHITTLIHILHTTLTTSCIDTSAIILLDFIRIYIPSRIAHTPIIACMHHDSSIVPMLVICSHIRWHVIHTPIATLANASRLLVLGINTAAHKPTEGIECKEAKPIVEYAEEKLEKLGKLRIRGSFPMGKQRQGAFPLLAASSCQAPLGTRDLGPDAERPAVADLRDLHEAHIVEA
jgi:hypothetical protein